MTNELTLANASAKERLTDRFKQMGFKERISALYDFFEEEKVLLTTSFGTSSAVLLHLVSGVRPAQKVHFINTLHHFPETLDYKNQLTELLGLDVVEVFPHFRSHELTEKHRLWETHPEVCCHLNKVVPMERLKAACTVWMSGAMAHQSGYRKHLDIFGSEGGQQGAFRFYPLLDLGKEEVRRYLVRHGLPFHPLEERGYGSVGCVHCTQPCAGRDGRWNGKGMTECGLHLRGRTTLENATGGLANDKRN